MLERRMLKGGAEEREEDHGLGQVDSTSTLLLVLFDHNTPQSGGLTSKHCLTVSEETLSSTM